MITNFEFKFEGALCLILLVLGTVSFERGLDRLYVYGEGQATCGRRAGSTPSEPRRADDAPAAAAQSTPAPVLSLNPPPPLPLPPSLPPLPPLPLAASSRSNEYYVAVFHSIVREFAVFGGMSFAIFIVEEALSIKVARTSACRSRQCSSAVSCLLLNALHHYSAE